MSDPVREAAQRLLDASDGWDDQDSLVLTDDIEALRAALASPEETREDTASRDCIADLLQELAETRAECQRLTAENAELRAIPRMPTHGKHYDPEAGACTYCHGVGACPECWGRVGIGKLRAEVQRLTAALREARGLVNSARVLAVAGGHAASERRFVEWLASPDAALRSSPETPEVKP